MEATRDAFGKQLVESAKGRENIVAINADLGKATKLSMFGDAYPDRFFEVGIAENNMIGIASGMSEHGYKPVIASFASFLTGKYDTIRCSVSYPNAPVVIVGSHGGLAIGKDGVTQMGLEDLSLMRSLPGMTVLNPATPNECRAMVDWICKTELDGPVYLRIGRQPVKEFFGSEESNFYGEFVPGITQMVKANAGRRTKAIILCTGCVLDSVMEAAEGLPVHVINVGTLKPFPKDIDYGDVPLIITVEDHSVHGGLGTAVAEDIITKPAGIMRRLIKLGVQDVFPESGPPSDLYEKYGLSARSIRKLILKETQFS